MSDPFTAMSSLVSAMLISRGEAKKSAIIQLLSIKWIHDGGLTFRLAITILEGLNLICALLMIANIIYDAWPARVRKLSLDFR